MRKTDLILFLRKLIQSYEQGMFGGAHEVHPGLPRGSRENYLYFTLAPSINFQRQSEALWRAADATYRDSATQFVFFPEETTRDEEDYFTALSKYSLASFKQKHTHIWYRLSQTLAQDYEADPRTLLSSCDHDVVKVRNELARRRECFPYLSGPKLANYWLYILSCFTDVSFKNRHAITIIPDTHVMQATVRLGVLPERAASDRVAVAEAWVRLLDGTGIAPVDLHAPLWRWSRMGFPTIEF